jgi:acyl dehydratase
MGKKYFEDIAHGERLHCKKITITKGAIIKFAKKFDPQPFHIDERAGKESVFGGLVASSLHVLSACTREVVQAQGHVAILSGAGMKEIKMYNPVRPGDTLSINAWWSNLRRSNSKKNQGYAGIRCIVTNQRKEIIMDFGYRYLLACRDSPGERVHSL